MLDLDPSDTDDDSLTPYDASLDWNKDLAGLATLGNQEWRLEKRREWEHSQYQKATPRQKPMYDRSTLAKNLQALMQSRGLSIQDTIQAISETGECHPREYRWLKRVATAGVVQTDGRTIARLEKLATFFNVTLEQLRTHHIDHNLRNQAFRTHDSTAYRRYGCMLDELLSDHRFDFLKSLLETLNVGGGNTESGQDYLLLLFQLLDTGTHDYLRDLLTELYGTVTREAAADYVERTMPRQ